MTTTSGSVAGYPIPIDDFDKKWTEKQRKEMEKAVQSLFPSEKGGEEKERLVDNPEVDLLNEMCLD